MKIACICSTKNEGDIIEAFVRLNSRICSSFFFIDESTDNTREIIALLAQEGYDLNYIPKSEGGYNQAKPTKAYLSYVKNRINPDWIFLLDADEIIIADDKEKLLQEMQNIPPNTYLAAEWKTYVPTTLSYFDSTSPLSDCFGLREDKGQIFRKVSLPGRIADHIITTPGNHCAKSFDGSTIREQIAKSYTLAHFPVRSAGQIIIKNLIGVHNLTACVDTANGEGFHAFPIFNMIRNKNYNLTLDDLADIAINYACRDQSPASSGMNNKLYQKDNFELKTELKYLSLGKINVIARLDLEIERLSRQIRKNKERSFWFKIKSKVKLLRDKLFHYLIQIKRLQK